MNACQVDIFNSQELTLIEPFVTNVDRPIFGLRNLPEVVKGALFSRYSRSDKSLRRILLDEFIRAPEAEFDRIVGSNGVDGNNQYIAIRQAENFYDRVLVGYGDDSVAELGGAHIACEGISNIAAKAIEDSRIGISPLEKSTRYVPFDKRVNGQYRYLREPSIMTSRHASLYNLVLDHLFDTYSSIIEPLITWVQKQTPQDAATSGRAYGSATRAKALDIIRGLLPMATLTNVGLYGNGRAFEYLLTKLLASQHQEVRFLAQSMQQELDQIIPSFVKRAKNNRGAQYAQYMATNRDNVAAVTRELMVGIEPRTTSTVCLVDYDLDAELRVVAAILYPYTNVSMDMVRERVATMSSNERSNVISEYVGERVSRFNRPGRAFEEVFYTFDLLADLGAYRDLHRHRVLTQERQQYTVQHGYTTPPELEDAGLAERYNVAMEQAAEAFEIVSKDIPIAAQYIVPFGFRTRWRIKLNLREAYHLIELRSSRQGHPSYRRIAQEMYHQISSVHPTLAKGMKFVDLNHYNLERLAAEQRIDRKISMQDQQ